MLDWAEDESVLLGDIFQGKRYGALDKRSGDEGPKAKNCLSELQVAMVKEFTELPGRSKAIAIHAPPIGPWDNWYDHELRPAGKSSTSLGADTRSTREKPRTAKRQRDIRCLRWRPQKAWSPVQSAEWTRATIRSRRIGRGSSSG